MCAPATCRTPGTPEPPDSWRKRSGRASSFERSGTRTRGAPPGRTAHERRQRPIPGTRHAEPASTASLDLRPQLRVDTMTALINDVLSVPAPVAYVLIAVLVFAE